jgi:glycosyltransferase involved in cell wall biosynthesis
MHRICKSLATHGFKVTLVGRQFKTSAQFNNKHFTYKRISCLFNKGFAFYAEYNIRLFLYLLFRKMDGICAIDLDTILPCLLISKIKKVQRIYDAHEYFIELKEVRTRPIVQKVWCLVEQIAVPQFKNGYTVSFSIADDFKQRFNHDYLTIRNLPITKPITRKYIGRERTLFFGGNVNEARGFEFLIPALKQLPYKLIIAGDGNFMPQLKKLIEENQVENKIILKGKVSPFELHELALNATLGISFVEKDGWNQYYSLANKFFDYIHAGLPQISMNFPEYARVNNHYKVAVLIDDLDIDTIVRTIDEVMNNPYLLQDMYQNCLNAREEYNWEMEEKQLINYYKTIFNS